MELSHPPPFLELVVHDLALVPPLSALCAGFELGEWRVKQFAAHLMEWLPEFALSHTELQQLDPGSAVRLFRRAAAIVYATNTYPGRGEFGELILHAVLRQVMNTVPAISKIFFKDSPNDTVKGFDAVHVVPRNDDVLQLWLGEAKFYRDLSSAISDAVQSIRSHVRPDYLRKEFNAIVNKIDNSWPYADRLRKLLDPNTSLDAIFDAICVPILLTYDSNSVSSFTEASDTYIAAFGAEVRSAHRTFSSRALPDVQIHLFLIPLGSKDALVSELHERLKAWQAG